ncbi:phage tail tape measure protein [Streptomyces sp. TBY4]|uniref:phage tail tape measure protein n=1 Tax=Streptomyces sp. TBY4 TaxID=2962030 RepID=UPI0020B8F6E0|nr:phage tail tape measure protein [Streptomyces sp. TBY4]MCP3758219.1 phage tail tape measure protein [Streptomyces sp. TBY4]
MSQTLAELLVELGINSDELTQGAQGAADQVNNSLLGIGGVAAGAAVGAMFAVGLTNAMDAGAANAKLTAQLGLTEAEAERAGSVAGDVFSAGFGESIDGVNEAIAGVGSAMGGLGKLSDDELQSMTTSALVLAETFELDVADAATAAGQLINQGLVKDGKEAFDVLTAAAQTLPKSMVADLPAIVTEYGTHFKRIGLDAQTSFGMMSQYVKAGGRDIDQAADVLHEFARITSEETDRAAEAFKGLGLDSKQMLAAIGKGGPDAQKALKTSLDALEKIKDPAKQAKLAVELFGDMAGESGKALWAMDPATAVAAGGMDNVEGAAKRAEEALAASPMHAYESIVRSLSTSLGEFLGPALQKVAEFAKDHPDAFKAIAVALGIFAVAMAIAAAAQWVMNAAMLANPITWIILAVVALIAVIVLIATKTTWFQTAWKFMTEMVSAAWDWLWTRLQAGWARLTELFLNFTGPGLIIKHWDTIKNAVGTATDWVTSKVEAGSRGVSAAIGWLSALPGRVSAYFGGMVTSAREKGTALVDWVRGIPRSVQSAVGDLGGLLVGAGRSIIQGLIDGVTGMIGSLRNRFSSITNMIPDWKGPMSLDMRLLTPSGEALMSGLMDGVEDRLPALRRTLQGVTSDIPGNVNVGVGAAARGGGQELVARLVIDAAVDSMFATAIKRSVRIDGRGDAGDYFRPRQ